METWVIFSEIVDWRREAREEGLVEERGEGDRGGAQERNSSRSTTRT
jgi:hypothetical protein